MKSENNTLVLGALLGFALFSGTAMAEKGATEGSMAPQATKDEVMCYGVNSCKGTGACSGKIDSCSGKDGCNAELKCAGHNSCKGKGLLKTTKKECADKGGKIASK
ncbi:MAG: hypothetical protein K2Q18_12115 [Bdellovibrionales bacterium]|nr:hypothetical protein [Bdellovibrionales bacterium]